jgi:sugar lactone lactonase YvrE
VVAEGFGFTDGACADAEGNFYFADVANGTSIQRISPLGEVTTYVDGVAGVSGMEFGPDARLYACQIREGRVIVFDRERKMTVLAENVQPNDLVVTRDGGVDPTGRISGVILKPQDKPMVSVCFAGERLHWMYVCSADRIYRRETKATGLLFFQ